MRNTKSAMSHSRPTNQRANDDHEQSADLEQHDEAHYEKSEISEHETR